MKKLFGVLMALTLAACGSSGSTANLKERRASDVELAGKYEVIRCSGTQTLDLANGLSGDATVSVMGYGDKGSDLASIRYSATFPLEEDDDITLMEETSEDVVAGLKKDYTDAIYEAGSGNAIFIYSSVETKATKDVLEDFTGQGFSCENFAK